jgi:hypothetical protein
MYDASPLPQARLFGEAVGDRLVERLLGRGVAPIAGDDMDEHDVVGAVDAEIVGVVDKLLGLVLVDQLEAIARRDVVGVHQRLVDAVGDGADVLPGLALEEGDVDERHDEGSLNV